MKKPTIEQVAWVFKQIMDNAGKGTFRYLIYDRMGFKEDAYLSLYEAGGMAINNAMFEIYDEKECNKELNIVTEPDGSQWVSLEDYNKLKREMNNAL